MLDMEIQFLKGVGPNRAKKLNRLNIFTVEDLLLHFPFKYEDRRTVKQIIELKEGNNALLKVKIVEYPKKTKIKKNMSIIKVIAKDDSGFITLTFFNQDFLMDKLNLNNDYYIYGKIKYSFGKYEVVNPEIEPVEKSVKAGKIIPVYNLTYGLTNNELIKIIITALETCEAKIVDIIPSKIANHYKLFSRKTALKNIHFPEDGTKYSIAKKTIAFEKLLIMQLGLLSIKNKLKSELQGLIINNAEYADKLLQSLPFKLTSSQLKVIDDIKVDMSSNKPMNRLVQGDVGSGKTIIAIYAMLLAVKSGYQASMMAPTEILALQHFETINEYVAKAELDVKIAFLSGSTKENDRNEILEKLKNNEIDILIGTHALIENSVIFSNIGLVITDEQHRFGVRQRATLYNKGKNPDVLIMTATPIPRTLALMLYGDLDISIIDELPPGRQPVKTYVLKDSQKEEAYNFIKKQVLVGRQAYIVAPLVNESENLNLDSAQSIYEELKNSQFSGFELGLLHGKMKNSEKEAIINKFYEGKIKILVSTTVIEVGINVPNASVMLILGAERFGLAQLHQLRGRVGRGKHKSYCILINGSKQKKSADRMNILVNSNNGFQIAEEDLKIRGPGDFFGTRQHGLSKFELQNIINDVNLVYKVQQLSKKIIEQNPYIDGDEYKRLKLEIIKLFEDDNIIFN